jgi:uncharacterized integral membrane protein
VGQPHTSRRADRSAAQTSWWTSRWFVGVLLAVIALVFVVENRQPASIRLLIPLVIMPQWAALTIALILGIAIGYLLRRRR